MLNMGGHYKFSDSENAITNLLMLNMGGHYKFSDCIDRGNVICRPQMSKYRATELPQSCFNKNKTWYGYI